jgi:cyclophilin family peptidyl-prolyl cis-trans isomerase
VRSLLFLSLAASLMTGCSSSGSSSGPNPKVVMETSMGNVTMELFQDKAPISVKNFLTYVDNHHYDGTIFHRIIPTFMIQGGGMGADMTEKATLPPIKNESSNGVKNERGTLAMARTNIPDSATSQFFINVVDNAFLNRASAPDSVGYAVFGRVIDGMDVVDKIRDAPTGQQDIPLQPVVIISVRRVATAPGAK